MQPSFRPIPPSMSSMALLNHLNLSYNNLTGPIPSTNQFQTFNYPSIYTGNPYLCGPPLTTKCSSGLKDAEGKDEEVEDEDGSEKLWFYISMGLGFIVGYWTFCSILMIKKSWRRAYFKFIDEMKDRLCAAITMCVASFRKKVDVERLERLPVRGKNKHTIFYILLLSLTLDLTFFFLCSAQ